jgi:hypothetical protein
MPCHNVISNFSCNFLLLEQRAKDHAQGSKVFHNAHIIGMLSLIPFGKPLKTCHVVKVMHKALHGFV